MNDLKVTGYDPYEWFFATRYKQGGRTVYAIDFSVREIITFLPKPDPAKPLDTQRKIYPAHANGFAQYVLEDDEWVSPALLLRGPSIFEFSVPDLLKDLPTGSTQFGQMGIPKDAKAEIKIVDGQHRTLGFHIAWEYLGDKIEEARGLVQAAKKNGEAAAVIAALEKSLFSLLDRRTRFEKERVSVQIVVVEDPAEARRIFVDINDNAKGITGSVKARFDDRKVVTRALNTVLEKNLFLKGKVDEQQDRIAGGSPYLLGAKHVADIIRALVVGHGRITPRLEDELVDSELAKEFDTFLEAMVDAFPVLSEYDDGDITAADLRAESLVGSNRHPPRVRRRLVRPQEGRDEGRRDREGVRHLRPPHGSGLPRPEGLLVRDGRLPEQHLGDHVAHLAGPRLQGADELHRQRCERQGQLASGNS